MTRAHLPLHPVSVPPGPECVAELMPLLESALAGGPALLPLPVGPMALRESIVTALRPGEPLDGEAAVVAPTSGSTGHPKGVLLPATAVIAAAGATHTRLGGPGAWLLALPATHVAGLMVLARSIVAGTTPAALDLRSGFDVAEFVAATDRLRARSGRCYTALVPAQLDSLITAGDAAVAALAGYEAVLLGGSAAPDGLVATAREAGVNVVTTYGMTETCGGCVYDGVPLDGVDVTVLAVAGDEWTPEGDDASERGRIAIAGLTLASGYRLQPELSAATFLDGWFRTSDIGSLGHGVLRVEGRLDDVAISGGVNVPLAAVDAILQTMPGVADAAAAAVPDEKWGQRIVAVVVPADPAHPPTLESIRSAVTQSYPAAYVPKEIVIARTLPTLPSGKVDRGALGGLT